MSRVRVLLRPGDGAVPRGATAIIIDVLRATTTLTAALDHGAAAVVPVATPDEAFARRAQRPGALACGERGGIKVPGFDLGNSPLEVTRDAVAGRTLLFSSTNGAGAMLAAQAARRRVLAAFVNASAVVEAVARDREITIVCAGSQGMLAIEDAACAGWLVERLAARGMEVEGAGARAARALAPRDPGEVASCVEGASHARALVALGPAFAADVAFAATLDRIGRAFEL